METGTSCGCLSNLPSCGKDEFSDAGNPSFAFAGPSRDPGAPGDDPGMPGFRPETLSSNPVALSSGSEALSFDPDTLRTGLQTLRFNPETPGYDIFDRRLSANSLITSCLRKTVKNRRKISPAQQHTRP